MCDVWKECVTSLTRKITRNKNCGILFLLYDSYTYEETSHETTEKLNRVSKWLAFHFSIKNSHSMHWKVWILWVSSYEKKSHRLRQSFPSFTEYFNNKNQTQQTLTFKFNQFRTKNKNQSRNFTYTYKSEAPTKIIFSKEYSPKRLRHQLQSICQSERTKKKSCHTI